MVISLDSSLGIPLDYMHACFKAVIEYYTHRGRHVFARFIHFSKAFDKVNHWKLFINLLDDNIDSNIIGIIAFGSHQQIAFVGKTLLLAYFMLVLELARPSLVSDLFNRY